MSDLDDRLAALPWDRDGDTITRSYEFDDYSSALGFVVRAGVAAEKANHHPDLTLVWGRVDALLTTHDDGGLTDKDADMAATLDELYEG